GPRPWAGAMRSPGWRRRAGQRSSGFCREFRRSFSVGPETVGIGEYYRTSLRSYGLEWQPGSCGLWPGGPRQEVISVCDPRRPVSVGAALVTLDRALGALNAADAASLPTAVQAQALRAL